MMEEMIIARVDDLHASLAPGQTTTAKQDTLNQQIAGIRASYEPEPGSQGGRRHKRMHKRMHKRTHKRMHKRAHKRTHKRVHRR